MSPQTNAGNISIIFLITLFAFWGWGACQLKAIMNHPNNWPRPVSPLIKSPEFANYLRNFNCLSPYLKCKSCPPRLRNNQGNVSAHRVLIIRIMSLWKFLMLFPFQFPFPVSNQLLSRGKQNKVGSINPLPIHPVNP